MSFEMVGHIKLGTQNDAGQPVESRHFIIQSNNPDIQNKIVAVYGTAPTVLNITFHSDAIEAVIVQKLQLWSTDNELLCEGRGSEGIRSRNSLRVKCPCTEKEVQCKIVTLLKVVLPEVSNDGYFLLKTKNTDSATLMHAALNRINRLTGGLHMRPAKLLRLVGDDTIAPFDMNRLFVDIEFDPLLWDSSSVAQKDTNTEINRYSASQEKPQPTQQNANNGKADMPLPNRVTLAMVDHAIEETVKASERKVLGRTKVLEKLHLYIKDPRADALFEEYVKSRFSASSLSGLSPDQLLLLWHEMDKSRDIVGIIYNMILKSEQTN